MSKSIGQQLEELEAQEMNKEVRKQLNRIRTIPLTVCEQRRLFNKYQKTKTRNKMARKSRQINRKLR